MTVSRGGGAGGGRGGWGLQGRVEKTNWLWSDRALGPEKRPIKEWESLIANPNG